MWQLAALFRHCSHTIKNINLGDWQFYLWRPKKLDSLKNGLWTLEIIHSSTETLRKRGLPLLIEASPPVQLSSFKKPYKVKPPPPHLHSSLNQLRKSQLGQREVKIDWFLFDCVCWTSQSPVNLIFIMREWSYPIRGRTLARHVKNVLDSIWDCQSRLSQVGVG